MHSRFALAGSLLLVAWSAAAQVASLQAQEGSIVVYRCVDRHGNISLGNAPCAPGQKQDVREMRRPVDAPPRPPAPRVTPRQAAPVVEAPTPYRVPPKPMYECTTADGKRYVSEDDRGNPRWVPLWTLGYPVLPRGIRLDSHSAVDPEHVHRRHWAAGGTWIRDVCNQLPPPEACSRLRDQRDAIRTRFFNAQPSERDRLRVEERGINARLDNDCGGH